MLNNSKTSHGALRRKWAKLYWIVTHVILPKEGSCDRVSYMETLILYSLITHTLISSGYIFMRYMEDYTTSQKSVSLSYEMLLNPHMSILQCWFWRWKFWGGQHWDGWVNNIRYLTFLEEMWLERNGHR